MAKRVIMILCTLLIFGLVVSTFALAQAEPPYKGVTIRYCIWRTPFNVELEKRAKAVFEVLTGAKVIFEWGSEEEIRMKLGLDFATHGGVYDVICIDNWELASHAEAGYVLPIDNYVQNPPTIVKEQGWLKMDDFPEVNIAAMTYKGEFYGFPWALEVSEMAYRTDLLEKYGVEVPTTTDELMEAAKKLTLDEDGDGKVDIYGIAMRGKRGEDNPIVSAGFGWAFSGHSWLDENFNPIVNEENYVKGVEFFGEILSKYGPPDVGVYTWLEVQTSFKEGKVAIVIDGSPTVGRLLIPEYAPKVCEKVGFGLPVAGPKGYQMHLWAPGYGINPYSTDLEKQVAFAFAAWATSAENCKAMAETLTGVNYYANKDVLRWLAKIDPSCPVALESARVMDASYMPVIPETPELTVIFGTHVSRVIAGEATAQDAMDWAVKEMRKVLEEAGY